MALSASLPRTESLGLQLDATRLPHITLTQQFVAVDDATGALKWASDGREGEHASLLLTPQNVVFLTNGANLIVAKRNTPAFAVEKRYEVAQASTFATPVLLGSGILVRDATGIMLLTGN